MKRLSIVLLMGILLVCSCKKEKIDNLVGTTYECVSEYDFTDRDIAYYYGVKINEIQSTNFYFTSETDLFISTTFRMIYTDGTLSTPHIYGDECKYSFDRDMCISCRERSECYDIKIQKDMFILTCNNEEIKFHRLVQ